MGVTWGPGLVSMRVTWGPGLEGSITAWYRQNAGGGSAEGCEGAARRAEELYEGLHLMLSVPVYVCMYVYVYICVVRRSSMKAFISC